MEQAEPRDDPSQKVNETLKNGMDFMMKYQFSSGYATFLSLYQDKELPIESRLKATSKLLFSSCILHQNSTSIDSILLDLKARLTKAEKESLQREFVEDMPLFATFTRYLSTEFFHKVNPFPMILEKAQKISTFNLAEALVYVSVTRQCTFVDSSLSKEIALTFLDKFKDNFAKKDEKFLRQLDEKKLWAFLKEVEKIAYIPGQEDLELEIAFTFVTSPFLSKKYDGLMRLNSFSFDRKILERIEKSNVEESLLESMHDSLLKEFVVFEGKVWGAGHYKFEVLEKFWKLSLSQHISTIDKYFAVMPSLFAKIPYRMSGDRWKLVKETTEFPAAALRFLATSGMYVKADEPVKECVSNLLWEAMIKCDNQSDRMNFVGVIAAYAPNNAAAHEALKQKCFDMVKSESTFDLGIALLLRIWKNVSPQITKEEFDFVLVHSRCSNLKSLFDLLVKISRCLKGVLDETEISKIQALIEPVLPTYADQVTGFVTSIMAVLSTDSLLALLNWFASLEHMDSSIFGLITTIFERLNEGLRSVPSLQLRGIEYLWKLLFTKTLRDIPVYMVSLIMKCEDDAGVKNFVRTCVEHIDTTGALDTLFHLIQKVEEPMDSVKKNKYVKPEQYFEVNLIGYRSSRLRVKKPLTYELFVQRVARFLDLPDNAIEIYYKGNVLPRGHVFQPDQTFNVVTRVVRRTYMRDWKNFLPSTLIKPYFSRIMDLVDSNNDLSYKAFYLINAMETGESEKAAIDAIVTSPQDFQKLLDDSKPYHLLYRMNTIGNRLLENNRAFETEFFMKGGFQRCFELLFTAQNIYPNDYCIQTIIEICIRLLKVSENRTDLASVQTEVISALTDNILEFISWIVAKLSKNERKLDGMCSNLLYILHQFVVLKPGIISEYEQLEAFISVAIFYPNQIVRDKFAKILSILDPMSYASSFINLLDNAATASCVEYFNLMYKVVESYPNQLELWKTIESSFRAHMLSSSPIEFTTENEEDESPYPNVDDLCGIMCGSEFVTGVFNTLHKLVFRVDLPKESASEFLIFVFERVIFNPQRYIPRPETLFPLVEVILRQNQDLLPVVVARMQKFSDLIDPPQPSEYSLPVLVSEKRQKGLNNMGATCYLNSSLQQIFRIQQIRNSLLSYRSETGADDWCFQLQMLLAKLIYSPVRFVDESPFVKLWKGYTDEPINPHEQQDAIEFLQLMFDRLDQKLTDKPVENSVTGETKQRMVGPNYESVKTGTFVDLDMVVKDVSNVTDSFRTFLEPDTFEYNDEERGKMNVEQYHTIQKAPETLILHLKRFEFDLEFMMPRKVNSYYSFPKLLDITPLMAEGSDPPDLYELTGIVMHSGSAAGGHYWSHIKDEQTNQWNTFNDTMVYPVTDGFGFPDNCFGGLESRAVTDPQTNQTVNQTVEKVESAYMLFYKKKNRDKCVKEAITLMPKASIEALLKDIEQVIIRDVTFSDGYLRFVDGLARIDDECLNEFFMVFFFKTLTFSFLKSDIEKIAQTIRSRVTDFEHFRLYILSRGSELSKYLLESPHPDMRSLCVDVIEEIMKMTPREKVVEFIDGWLEKIPDCLEYSQNFDHFFRPILFYVKRFDQTRPDILSQLLSIVNECQSRQLACNLSSVFEILLVLAKASDKQEEYRDTFLSSRFFNSFGRSELNAFDFACLLISFQYSRAVVTEYQQGLLSSQSRSVGKDSNIRLLASHFAATLAVEDTFTRDRIGWFNSIFRAKNWSQAQIADFIADAAAQLQSHKVVGTKELFLSNQNVRMWLLSKDPLLRNGTAELIFAMFPSYPKVSMTGLRVPTEKQALGTETEQKNLGILLDQLFAMTNTLVSTCKSISGQSADVQMPSAKYYEVLGWAIYYASDSSKVLLKHRSEFADAISHFCSLRGSSRSPIYHLLDFLSFSLNCTLAQKFFDTATLKVFLEALSNIPSESGDVHVERVFSSLGQSLSCLPPSHNDIIANSGVFEAALNYGLYQIPRIQQLVLKVLTDRNSVVIAKALFKRNLISAHYSRHFNDYFDIVKRLLLINNANIEQFYKSECYAEIVTVLGHIFRKRLSLSDYTEAIAILELLQLFCAEFIKENTGKTVFLFFDKLGSFVSFWNSNLEFLKNLTEWIQMSSVPKQFTSTVITLLRQVLSCDNSLSSAFIAIYKSLPKDFYLRLHSDLHAMWGSMIAHLCRIRMRISSEEALAIILLDLRVLKSPRLVRYQVFIEYVMLLCEATKEGFLNDPKYIGPLRSCLSDALDNATEILLFGKSVRLLFEQLDQKIKPDPVLRQRWVGACFRVVTAVVEGMKPELLSDCEISQLAQEFDEAKAFVEFSKRGVSVSVAGVKKETVDRIVSEINGSPVGKAKLAQAVGYFVN